MIDFMQWCNKNNGFFTLILSIIGLLLSGIAIVVSIHTSRLPYKKKLLLNSSLMFVASNDGGMGFKTCIAGLEVSATKIGNRPISLTYLGYAIKKKNRFYKICPINRHIDCRKKLSPLEMLDVQFPTKELLNAFLSEEHSTIFYVIANDTEGTEYKQKIGPVGDFINRLIN